MRRLAPSTLLASALLLPLSPCWAADSPQTVGACFATAARKYGLDETLLRAIAKVESNESPGAVHFDADGTHDVGVMQINSSHFADLQRRLGLDERALLERPCVNVLVGASILADFVGRFGNTWRAVGSYGAGTAPTKESARLAYAALVSHALILLMPSPKGRVDVRVATTRSADASTHPRMLVLE